ncbi:MAG: PEGA domain-containing protein [Acidobacteria bacterium]|nr:PEGA domain-containing protein [Acidobacteriota bacterium]
MTWRPVAAQEPRWIGFVDRLGERVVTPEDGGGLVERLRIARALGTGAAFAASLESVRQRLESFVHPACLPVRRVEGPDDAGRVTLVSDHVDGTRLSCLLERASREGAPLPTGSVLHVLQGIVGALADLHAQWLGAFHGLLGIDRILLAPDGRVLLTEYIIGGALARHQSVSRADLWPVLGLAVPQLDDIPPFVPLTDHIQLGVVGLSLLLNRPLGPDEYPARIEALLDEARETDLVGQQAPLGASLRQWLARALLVSPDGPYPTLPALAQGLDALVGDDAEYVAVPIGLDVEPDPLELEPGTGILATDVDEGPLGRDIDLDSEGPADAWDAGRLAAGTADPYAVGHVGPAESFSAVDPGDLDGSLGASTHGDFARTPADVESDWRFDRGNLLDDEPPAAEPAEGLEVVRYGAVGGYDPQEFEVATVVAQTRASEMEEPHAETPVSPAPPTDAEPVAPPAWTPPPPPDPAPAPVAPRPAVTSSSTATDRKPDLLRHGDLYTALGFVEEPSSSTRPGPDSWPPVTPSRSWAPVARIAAALVVAMALGVGAWWSFAPGSAPAVGWLNIDSRPSGAEVVVDGHVRGRTPAVVELPAGMHLVELRGIGSPVLANLEVRAGEQSSEVVALRDDRADGTLAVETLPAGAEVHVDGELVGYAPVRAENLRPGEHVVLVRNGAAAVERRVTIEPAQTVDLSVPLSGWLAVTASLPLDVFDGEVRIGSSRERRLAVAAGRRHLVFLNEAVGFRLETDLDVAAGRVTNVPVSLPNGWVSVTSDVPADVRVDGKPVGRTPVPSLELPLGMHEVTVSHPRYGDQTFTVLVAIGTPTRVNATLGGTPVRGRTGTQRRVR